jgi:hypothetical protein
MPTPHTLLRIPVLIMLCLLAVGTLPAQVVGDDDGPAYDGQSESSLPSIGGDETFRIVGPLRTVENRAYSDQRSTLHIGDISIEADRMVLDLVTREVLAEGNVVLKEGKDKKLEADRLEYSHRFEQGFAVGSKGRMGALYFYASPKEDGDSPTFRQVNADQMTFRGVRLTTNVFPKPMWWIHSSEAVLIDGERWSLRNPVLWIRGVPVFWLPYYSRAFEQGSPWNFEVGNLSDYGFYTRITYRLLHETKVPAWFDPTKTRVRDKGVATFHGDIFTSATVGAGVDYDYSFNFDQHMGQLSVYGVRDTEREEIRATGDDDDDSDSDSGDTRYFYRHRHNSMFGRTIWQLNVDWVGDADIYYDLYDPFQMYEGQRGRRAERGVDFAGGYVARTWLARASVRIRERLSRDRAMDFTDPRDDDLDYEADADFLDEDSSGDGIASDRYGRVSERFQGTIATRLKQVSTSPLYWQGRLSAFRALDAGFNQNNSNDDDDVTGLEAYTSLTHRLRLDPRGRLTWLNTIGVGAGNYDRSSTQLTASKSDFPERLTDEEIADLEARVEAEEEGAQDELDQATRGAKFLSPSEVYLGTSERIASYDDVDSQMVWADYTSRLNARFTNDLAGNLRYRFRRTSDNGIDQFYRRVGRVEAWEDIYNFPTNSHWIEGELNYNPLVPMIASSLVGGYNIDTGEDRYANDRLWYVGLENEYSDARDEFRAFFDLFLENHQLRDPSDPNAFEQTIINGYTSLQYVPVHQRWWLGLDISGYYNLDEDPIESENRERRRLDENEPDVSIRPLVGRQLGPKYRTEAFIEYNTRYSDIRAIGVTIIRDLVDADLLVFVGLRNHERRTYDDDDDDDDGRPETDLKPEFRVSLALKVGGESSELGGGARIGTMRDRRRSPSYIE